jgi:sec-independent protein translocase protein TatC
VARRLRPIGHEDRLSIVEHLDELRTRLFICGAALSVAFCLCFWQNHPLINALNRALPHQPASVHGIASEAEQSAQLRAGIAGIERYAYLAAGSRGLSAGMRHALIGMAQSAGKAAAALPKHQPDQVQPVTLGVGESFTTTLTVVGYFALLITLPVLLYELYAFVVPALNPNERVIATPVIVAAPLLFVAGAVFTYFLVLPPAIHFLQGYNAKQFQILVQAKTYYKFEILLMMGIGAAFEVPLVLLGLQKLGVITADTLTGNWRYAIVLIAVVTAAMPGVDPVTMTLEMLPLVLLYVASIVMLRIVDRRAARRAAAELTRADRGFDVT